MDTPQFLIAKYIPDLQRMEPRNIGIVVWADGRVAARFTGENDALNEVGSFPEFVSVKNRPVYQAWVAYWRDTLASDSVKTSRGSFSRDDASFLAGLKSTARENFVLVNGGVLFTEVNANTLQSAADSLFQRLVSNIDGSKSDNSAMLDKGWKRVIVRTGLRGNPHYHPNASVKGKFYHIEREYKFSAVIGNGAPMAALQKVSVSNALSVNNASLMFDGLRHNDWSKNRCVVFYYGDETALSTDDVRLNLAQLGEVSTPINVIHTRQAVREFRALGIKLSNGAG